MQSLGIGPFGRPSRGVIAIGLLAGFCGSWAALDMAGVNVVGRLAQRIFSLEAAAPRLPETQVSELPGAPNNGRWDDIAGLNFVLDPGGSDAPMHLTAVGLKRHAMVYHVDGLSPGTIFRASVEVKPSAANDAGVMMEVRDSETSPGQVPHYAMALFDFRLSGVVAPHIVATRGEFVADGVETKPDGWLKIWVDQKTADGAAFVQLQIFDRKKGLGFDSTGQQISLRRISIETVAPDEKQ